MSPLITYREANLPEDAEQIAQIDASFTTDAIYCVNRDGDNLGITLTALEVPITKGFPMDDLNKRARPWELALVAMADERICGFVAAGYQPWNRRLTVWHLYVNAGERRQGIGRALINRIQQYGCRKSAVNMWLETSNMNTAAVQIYRRLGFELCGLDTTLYDGTPAAGEIALFFSRPISEEVSHRGIQR